MTANLAVAALDTGAVAALSLPHGISALKKERRTAVKFLFLVELLFW